MKRYKVSTFCYKNGKLYGEPHYQILSIKDERKVPERFELDITWENLLKVYKSFGHSLPIQLWDTHKGIMISSKNKSLFNSNTRDIKEWKDSNTGLRMERFFIKI